MRCVRRLGAVILKSRRRIAKKCFHTLIFFGRFSWKFKGTFLSNASRTNLNISSKINMDIRFSFILLSEKPFQVELNLRKNDLMKHNGYFKKKKLQVLGTYLSNKILFFRSLEIHEIWEAWVFTWT